MSTFVQPEDRAEVTPEVVAQIDPDLIDPTPEETPEEDLVKQPAEADPREAIARKFAEKKLKDMGFSEEPELEPEPELETKVEPEDSIPPLTEPDNPDIVTVKVNGRTIEVDRSKVESAGGIELYQKQVAVNDGFQALAEEKKRLIEEKQRFEDEQVQLAQTPVDPTPVPVDPDLSATDDQKMEKLADGVRKFREALLDGDDKNSDQVLIDLLLSTQTASPVNPTVPEPLDVEEIKLQAAQSAAQLVREENRVESTKEAIGKFYEQNPEVLNDPRLFSAVDTESAMVSDEHPEWKPQAVLEESLKRVNDWRNPPTADPEKDKKSKIEAKRKLSTPTGSDVRSQAPAKPQHPTDSDYVTALRKQRGLE